MMRRLKFIVSVSVLAAFAVVTMATQGYAHTALNGNCSDLGSFTHTFTRTMDEGKWTILKYDEVDSTKSVRVDAMMFDGSVPGPAIKVAEGDTVCVKFINNLAEDTTVHFHGINAPYLANDTDGVSHIGAGPDMMVGQSLAVHWTAPPAGTYMYHAHHNAVKQMGLGLYGAIIVTPKGNHDKKLAYDEVWMLSEWRVNKDASNDVIDNVPTGHGVDEIPNYFTINGKAFDPHALTADGDLGISAGNKLVVLKQGQKARIRLIGIGAFSHPMHMHGRNFRVVARDSNAIPTGLQSLINTITVHPGEIVDIEFEAGMEPEHLGNWAFHCHVVEHSTNNEAYPGGLVSAVVIQP